MGTREEDHRSSSEAGAGAGGSPRFEGAKSTPSKRLVRALILGVGVLALGIAVIFSAGSDYSWEVGMPLFHLGAAVCWLGHSWGKRPLGLDLILIGVLYSLAGWFWYGVTWGSEQYPPAPYWPCYVVLGISGVSLASGIAVVVLRRRANVRAGTQMPPAAVRRKTGTWLLGGGAIVMCAGGLSTGFMALAPLGLICAVAGGALLGKRVLGRALMGVGLLCAVYFLMLALRFSPEVRRSTSLVVVMAICLALAVVGAVYGAVLLLRVRGARESVEGGSNE